MASCAIRPRPEWIANKERPVLLVTLFKPIKLLLPFCGILQLNKPMQNDTSFLGPACTLVLKFRQQFRVSHAEMYTFF